MISKCVQGEISHLNSPWELSMSPSEPPRRVRSLSFLRSERRTQCVDHERVSLEGVLLRLPQRSPSQQISPVTPIRSRWLMLVGFVSKVEMLFSDMLFAALCWISAEFVAGCALYARGMLFIPESMVDAADAVEPTEPARPAEEATIHAFRRE
jgi:hypothetical protein